MIIKNLNIYFFLVVLCGVSIAGFLLIRPFLAAIFVAALFAVMLYHPYEILVSKIKSRGIASAIMLCVVAICVVLPVVALFGLIANEVSNIIVEITTDDSAIQNSSIHVIESFMNIPIVGMAFEQLEQYSADTGNITNIVKNIANASVIFIQKTYHGVTNGVIGIFVMFFTLFYFFIDGKRIVRYGMYLSPLKDVYETRLMQEFISMARATIKGTVVIGFIQGLIGGISFAIAGVMSPILWTVIMVVLGIIPAVGSSLVIFPVAIIMLLLGNIWQAVFLIIVGIIVSWVDNLLRPKLVGNDTQMHGLAVFFATLGGLKLFGFIGFIVGPIIMALMLAMWKIYAQEFRKELDKFNA